MVVSAQDLTQTVKGTVTDKASDKPLSGVSVSLAGRAGGAVTDAAGRYVITGVPVGRQQLAFSYAGYGTVVIPDILFTSGKQVVADAALEQQISMLSAVTVNASGTRKGAAQNEFAGVSSRSFSMSDVTRYAGGRNDPARLVSNFAGVSTTDDSRNDIVVRGNSPSALLWRLEGIPIPNPNHFSLLGTTGGPVSAVNTNALKTSDFYTSAFPAEYGNAVGAVFDLGLRNGNTDKFERMVQLNLFSGLEAMLEGPLGSKQGGASFLAGFRYSFAQLAQSAGLTIGTQAVPNYQDWVVNISLPGTKLGSFNFFSMGGNSRIDFIGQDLDSTDVFANKDEDMYVRTSFGIFGIRHTIDVGANSYVRTVLSYAYENATGDRYRYYDSLAPERAPIAEQYTHTRTWRLSSYINSKINARFTLRGGALAESMNLNSLWRSRLRQPAWATLRDYDATSLLLQPYVQGRYRFTDKLALNAGIHGIWYTFNSTGAIEPRMNLTYALSSTQTLSAAYGLHSQLQPLPVYLYRQPLPEGKYDQSNENLSLTKAHHFVLGYEWRFLPSWRLKTETYYQYLFDVPVEQAPSGFSVLNGGADFTFPEKGFLVSKGTGTNAGLELTLEKFFSKGVYLLGTASIFNAQYKGSDGIQRNSTFNNRTVFNILAGREYKIGKAKRNTFTIDLKLANSGGRYYTPVNLQQSIAANAEVLDERYYNSERLSAYFRLDTRFGIQINSRRRKMSHALYLDLQNITNNQNVFLQRYNTVRKEVGTVYQTGFFPDLLYRLQF